MCVWCAYVCACMCIVTTLHCMHVCACVCIVTILHCMHVCVCVCVCVCSCVYSDYTALYAYVCVNYPQNMVTHPHKASWSHAIHYCSSFFMLNSSTWMFDTTTTAWPLSVVWFNPRNTPRFMPLGLDNIAVLLPGQFALPVCSLAGVWLNNNRHNYPNVWE